MLEGEILRDPNLTEGSEICTRDVTFRLVKEVQKGYPGIGTSEITEIDPADMLQMVTRDLRNKAKQRLKWDGSHLSIPYIVAFDCELSLLDLCEVEGQLSTGTLSRIKRSGEF